MCTTSHRRCCARCPPPQIFRAVVCDVSVNTLTLEVTGKEDKMVALKDVLEPYGEPQNSGMASGLAASGLAAAGASTVGRDLAWGIHAACGMQQGRCLVADTAQRVVATGWA